MNSPSFFLTFSSQSKNERNPSPLNIRNKRSITNRDGKNGAIHWEKSKVFGPKIYILFVTPSRGNKKDQRTRNFALRIPFRSSKRIFGRAELDSSSSIRGIKSGTGKFGGDAWNFKTSKTMIRSVSILSRGRNLAGSSARIIPTWDKTGATSVCRKLGVENRPAFRRYDKTNREKSEF